MQNLQKRVYHKNRFFIPPKTPRFPLDSAQGERFREALRSVEIPLKESYIEIGILVIYVDKNNLLALLESLKSASFDILSDMSAIHLSDDSFEVFYALLSMDLRLRIRVKVATKESVESVSGIYRNALWAERETWDMLGVRFLNHPNLKRLIMPNDWSGHPLRKDYPLHGDESAQWYEIDKIFGESYREVVGKEQRDSSFVNPKDTFNFAHLGYEVPRGNPPSEAENPISYQEKEGVFVVTKFDKTKQLEKRR